MNKIAGRTFDAAEVRAACRLQRNAKTSMMTTLSILEVVLRWSLAIAAFMVIVVIVGR